MSDEFFSEFLPDETGEPIVDEPISEDETPTEEQGTPAHVVRQSVNRLPLRRELVNEGRTLEEAAEVRSSGQLTDEDIATGKWIKLASVSAWCKMNGIQVSRLVKATGGDRAMHAPRHPRYQVRWLHAVRYISSDATSDESAEFLRNLVMERKPKSVEQNGEQAWTVEHLLKKNKAELIGYCQAQGVSLGEELPLEKASKKQLAEALVASQA